MVCRGSFCLSFSLLAPQILDPLPPSSLSLKTETNKAISIPYAPYLSACDNRLSICLHPLNSGPQREKLPPRYPTQLKLQPLLLPKRDHYHSQNTQPQPSPRKSSPVPWAATSPSERLREIAQRESNKPPWFSLVQSASVLRLQLKLNMGMQYTRHVYIYTIASACICWTVHATRA